MLQPRHIVLINGALLSHVLLENKLQQRRNGNGLQFIALFAIIISTILFGILGILEGKELAAILSGISGFILGKGLNVNLTKNTDKGDNGNPV